MDQSRAPKLPSVEKLLVLTGAGIAHWDSATDQYFYSNKYCELLGYPAGTLGKTHRDWLANVFPDDQEIIASAIQNQIDDSKQYDVQCRLRTYDGNYHWFRVCGQYDASIMTVAIIDIGPIKRLENELQNKHIQLKNLTLRVIERQESERKHIARELHDEIGQVLTAVKINLQSIRPSVAGSPSAEKLTDSIAIVDELAAQVRNLSRFLRPPQLDALGLLPALSSYVENRVRPNGLTVSLNCDPLFARLQPEVETNCFRIVQEALTNVLRHANATMVSIELRRFENQMVINVKDDGVGFDVDEVRARTSRGECVGLFGMEERAELFGGQVKFFSGDNDGTRIEICLPLLLAKPRGRTKPR